MQNLKQQVQQLGQYITDKLINGEFTFKSFDEYYTTLIIDEIEVKFWSIYYEKHGEFRLFDNTFESMKLSLSEDERIKLLKLISSERENLYLPKLQEQADEMLKKYNDLMKKINK